MTSAKTDTIAALATPPGEGAISVIRISGNESLTVMEKCFYGKRNIADCPPNTIVYGKFLDSDNNVIDDMLVSVFHAPNSYTGEDSVEISTHGSQLVVKKIIEELLNKGIRLAEPGEFTKRAFLNGKIDLAQAEAVADIIFSRTEASLRGARNQLDGLLSARVDSLRELLVNTSSMVELELDFAEEDLEFLPLDKIKKNVIETIHEIDKLLDTYSFGRVIREGVNVAIVGKPNVGKSSLLNHILKESRAIVSEIPGTTRDVIREEVSIKGVLFRLFDTAGIRLASDAIEKEGVIRSREVVRNSDLVLFISDVTDGFASDLYEELLGLKESDRIIKIMNKIDLKDSDDRDTDIKLSALRGDGIAQLMEIMNEKALGTQNYSEKAAIVSNVRHYDALRRARESLEKSVESVDNKLSGEFIAVDLRNAEDSLGEIIGKVTTDDILNNIFEKFCIGK
jgi:tRNA modification GTPase